MVRNYIPKTDRKHINEENINDAIREVISKTLSIRKAAEKYGIKVATLQHRIEKSRKLSSSQLAPSMEMAQAATSTHRSFILYISLWQRYN